MRASTSFPKKTALGVEEMRQRTHGLSQRHRTMLLLVNGKRERTEVLTLAGQAGVDAAVLDELVAIGLVDDGRVAATAAPSPSPVPEPVPAAVSVPDAGLPSASLPLPPPPPPPPPPPEVPAAAPAVVPVARGRAAPAGHRSKPSRAAVPVEVRRFDRYPVLTAAKPPARRNAPIAAPAAPADEAAEQRLLAEARTLLIGTLLVEGPVSSSMTVLRVRKARTRDELAALVWEIERRLIVARRPPEAQARLKSARELLGLGNTVVEGEDEPDDRDTVS